jgi:hypothetical protein
VYRDFILAGVRPGVPAPVARSSEGHRGDLLARPFGGPQAGGRSDVFRHAAPFAQDAALGNTLPRDGQTGARMSALQEVFLAPPVVLAGAPDRLDEDRVGIARDAAARQKTMHVLAESLQQLGRDVAVEVRIRARDRRCGALTRPGAGEPAAASLPQETAGGLPEICQRTAVKIVARGRFRPVDIDGGVERPADREREVARLQEAARGGAPDAVREPFLPAVRHELPRKDASNPTFQYGGRKAHKDRERDFPRNAPRTQQRIDPHSKFGAMRTQQKLSSFQFMPTRIFPRSGLFSVMDAPAPLCSSRLPLGAQIPLHGMKRFWRK